jgi:hypothetical protein
MPLASMDQLTTPTPAALHEAFPPEDAKRPTERLELPHTPKPGSPAGPPDPAGCAVGSAHPRGRGGQ